MHYNVSVRTSHNNRIKVVHMSSVHPSYDVRILSKECMTLAKSDYEVVFIAPGTKDESIEEVRILAVKPSKDRLDRFTRTMSHVLRHALRENANVYHFHDPELIIIGLMLHLCGKIVIYDVHEDLPNQIMSKSWIPSILLRPVSYLMGCIEALAHKCLDGIIAATPKIAVRFPNTRTTLIQNFPILGEFVPNKKLPFDQRLNWIAYVGGLEVIRGLREMVEAMCCIPKYLNARLKCAGISSDPRLIEEVKLSDGSVYIDLLGWQSRLQIAELLGACRMGLVVLHPTLSYVDSQPIKLFEYMSAGLPVIASDFPLWREIVEGAKCGILVDPTDPQAIADAIRWLLEHPAESEEMGMRGHSAIIKKYNWDSESEKLLSLYSHLITGAKLT